MVRQAHLPGPHPSRPPPRTLARAGAVVRREPRWAAQQPGPLRQDAGHGVQRGHLERLLGGQVGQDRRDPLGDRRLAGAARPDQHQRVPARGGDLDGVADVLEAVEVAQVDVVEAVLAAPGGQRAGRRRRPRAAPRGTSTPRSTAETWASERTPNTVMPGTSPASAAWGSGTKTRVMPWAAAAMTIGSTPGTGRRPPETDSSPMKAQPSRRSGVSSLCGLVGRHHRDGDGQVVVGAALGQVGRREQDRDPLGGRPPTAVVVDRHPHPVAGLGQALVDPSDQGGADDTRRDVDLHVDHVPVGPLQGQRPGRREGHQPTPSHVLDLDRAARRGQHADHVDADVLGVAVVDAQPARREASQPRRP